MAENKELKVSISSNLDATGFNQAQSKIKDLSSHTDKLSVSFKTFAGIAASLGAVTIFKQQITETLDFADSLNKLSQKTGITADGLYSLSAAAKLSDVDFASLEGSLSKFSKGIGEASMGTGKAKDAFERLGVSIKNQDGTLKDSFSLLTELSDQFKNMPDGAMKATTAMELFGKSGADMIPLLNSGSEALKEFSGIMNNDTSKAAEEFNDSLTKVGLSTNAFFTQIIKDLSPTIKDLTKNFNELAESVNKYTINMDVAKRSVFDIKTSKDFDAKKELLEKELKELQKLIKDDDGWLWFGLDDRTKSQYVARIARIQQQLAQLNGVAEDTFKKQDSYVKNLEDRFSYTISPERQKEIDDKIFDIQKETQDKKLDLAKKHSDEIKKLAEDTRKFEDEQFAILAQNSEKSFKQLDAIKDWAKEEEESAKNATNAMKSMQDAMITYYEAIGDTQSAYYAKEAKLIDELKEQKLLTDTQINAIISANREKFRDEQFEKENKWLYDFFDNMNKALDNELLEGFRGKFKSFGDWLKDLFASVGDSMFASMSRTFAGGITDTLQGGIVNSFKSYGLFGGASLVGSTLSASDMSSLVNSGATVSGGKITTSGGTIIDQASGMVTNQGSDAMSILGTASSLKTAYGVLTDGISGSILSGFNGIGNLVGNFGFSGFGGAISNFGAGFASPLSFATQSPLAGLYGSGVAAEIPMSTMAGGMLSSGLIGYGMGSLGDAIFGAKTQAGNLGAVGAAIGSIIPGIGTLLGGVIGSVLGGFFGSTSFSGYKFNSDYLGGEEIDAKRKYKTKSWFSSSTSYKSLSDDDRAMISGLVGAYDYLSEQLDLIGEVTIRKGTYSLTTLQKEVSESFISIFTGQFIDSDSVNEIYTYWKDYAKEIDTSITEALTSAVGGYTTYKRGFTEWSLGSGTAEQLSFTANYLQKDFEALSSVLGASDVTVENFLAKYDEAIKSNFTQDTITSWSSLGDALMKATDANKKYQDSLTSLNATLYPQDMMLNKGTDGTKVFQQIANDNATMKLMYAQMLKTMKDILTLQQFGATA